MKMESKERFSEAVKLKKIGHLENAKELLAGLTEEDPKSTAILAVLGHVCWEMGLLEEAVSAFKRAIQVSPRLEAVSLGLFHCLWELGKRNEALEELGRFQSLSFSDDYERIVRQINEEDREGRKGGRDD